MPTAAWDENLDAARQSQLYSYLDHPKHALTLTCLDARHLQLMSSRGGLRLFRHKERPAVFVHLVGRVIGIEEKEKKVAWLVDDGSAVVAVHHIFKQPANTPLSKEKVRPSRKGKERQADNLIGGIPSEYLLPPPPPLPLGSETQEKRRRNNKAPINVADAFEIGDLVSVVGRVELWVDRKERVVFVDSVLQGKEFSVAEQEGFIQTITDPNDEPKHLLRALLLSSTEYSKSYQIPKAIAKETSEWAPIKLREIPSSASSTIHAPEKTRDYSLRIRGLRIMEEPRRSLRVMEDVSEVTNNGAARKRSLGATRRLLSGRKGREDEAGLLPGSQSKQPDRQPESESFGPSSSLLSVSSSYDTATPRQRQLRHYTKLSDSKMTDSTFRVYVEKHIVDCCAEGSASSSPNATPKASKRGGALEHTPAREGPPAFTLNYLAQVAELRGHAMRTVEVATKRREEKKRRNAGSLARSTPVTTSMEKSGDKVKRLYASVMQAMLMDGIIVLASPMIKVIPPFNGKRQCQNKSSPESLSPLHFSESEQGYRRTPMQEDAYQVVTPALLLEPIMGVLSRSRDINTVLSSAQIVQKMQASDERWRFIRSESVQEGMQLLLP